IQENSDTTYRIYDWDRTKKGRAARQMHITEAMQCVDFEDVEPGLLPSKGESLVSNELFMIEKWILSREREIAASGQFAIVVCVSGTVECAGREFTPGDFFLVTAQQQERVVRPGSAETALLKITLPQS
ncbi:MAG TPA: mannose-6-phosphate isomerase, partial [Chthoniobacterales bacterium]|nr:mannose-6-phosphate isomerase [Chthoniobacterales bacterium]